MKRTIPLISTVILAILIGGCRTQPVNLVRIPVKSKNTINFLKFRNLAYIPVKAEKFPSEYDPGPIIDYFFMNDFPKTIEKPILKYVAEQYDLTNLQEGDLLLIGGDISLNIKERNVIDEKKEGKKRRVFVKIENWEMQLEIFFRDAKTGKDVFSKTLIESLNGADKSKPDYNFEFLFRKITEKLVNLFMGLGRLETRYLMK